MVYGNNITIYDDEAGNDVDRWDVDNVEHIYVCYRIHTALELFKEKKECEVRFKDDLSSTSSSSSDSDDWTKHGFKMTANMYMTRVY